MATWLVSAFSTAATSTVAGANRLAIATAFGMCSSEDWASNRKISVDSFNTRMHRISTSISSGVDSCGTKHLQAVTRGGSTNALGIGKFTRTTATGGLISSATITSTAPRAWDCIEFNFTHTVPVMLDPITIWSGSGDAVTAVLKAASVYFFQQGVTTARTWVEATVGAPLTIWPRPSAAGHNIYLGLCIKVKDVTFNASGRIKISATYS
jgi:hypothetical protein